VNAAPGFRMHTPPTIGDPQYVAKPVVDMLFPPATPSRIPIVAVTGTNGKTMTSGIAARPSGSARCRHARAAGRCQGSHRGGGARNGFAVLNADEELVPAMRLRGAGRIVWFTTAEPGSEIRDSIDDHCRRGGRGWCWSTAILAT
jgi:hypothetical protein